MKGQKLIAGIGSALVDILLRESDEFVTRSGAAKGGMTLVDSSVIEGLLAQSAQTPTIVPGGSACNTILGIGMLGSKARFIGKRGNDPLGELFEKGLVKHKVEPVLSRSASPTGRVLSIITPDAQRTMLTFLGASSESVAQEISTATFAGAALVHIEGYLLFNEALITAACQAAKEAGALISLDLASFTVVAQKKEILQTLIDKYVDIVIANEDEAAAFTGTRDEPAALKIMARKASVAILKVGKRGSYIAKDGKTIRVERMGDGCACDTTGAGDLWASGFLYGYVNDYELPQCGKIAAACGYEVCQVMGAQIPQEGWPRIRKHL